MVRTPPDGLEQSRATEDDEGLWRSATLSVAVLHEPAMGKAGDGERHKERDV